MIENLYQAFLISDEDMPIMLFLSAVNLGFALAGIYVFLRRTQIVLLGLAFFGSLWAAGELPYAMHASFIASIGFKSFCSIYIYLLIRKLRNKPIPTIIHPDW